MGTPQSEPLMVITGASRGIGKHLVEYYLDKGFTVAGCSRREAHSTFDRYQHYCLDIADEHAVKQMFLNLRKTYGRLDILINNAGVASMNHFLLTPSATLQRVMDTNFVGTFLCCREAAKIMKTRGNGRIINFSTVAVPLKLAGEAAYSASKAAVVNLTQTMARELAEFGITINAIGPTPVRTDLIKGVPPEKIDFLIGQQAIRRMGEYRDIVNVIDFFISPRSDFITGQVIYLGGI